jgi:hypothetical protein
MMDVTINAEYRPVDKVVFVKDGIYLIKIQHVRRFVEMELFKDSKNVMIEIIMIMIIVQLYAKYNLAM